MWFVALAQWQRCVQIMIRLCFSLEIACTVTVVIALVLSVTPSPLDNTIPPTVFQATLTPKHTFIFFPSTVGSRWNNVKAPVPPHPPLWSEILTASTQSLSMKGQLFPALCWPAQASTRCSPPCSDPPPTHTHTESRLVWKNEMPLPEGVRLRGHSTKLCPHC